MEGEIGEGRTRETKRVKGRARREVRDLTVKPAVDAQMLSPAALMIAALSMWPVPTRLYSCQYRARAYPRVRDVEYPSL